MPQYEDQASALLEALGTINRPPMPTSVANVMAMPNVPTGTEANLQDLPLEIQAMINQTMEQVRTGGTEAIGPGGVVVNQQEAEAQQAVDQMMAASTPLATDLNDGLTVQQYRDQEIRAGRTPEFTNVPGATGYQIPDTYGDAAQGNISANMSIIGRGGVTAPTAEAFMPSLSANAINAYKPEGANDLDKYNNLQKYIVEVKGQIQSSARDYDKSLRNPVTERLEQLARFQLMNKNYDSYNDTQTQLRMMEQERQTTYAANADTMFSGHVQALEMQQVELGILQQRAGVVVAGQREQAKYDIAVGRLGDENTAVVNRLSVMNASEPKTEIGKMVGDTDNPAKNQFARMTIDGQINSYEDVAIHGAFVYKDPVTSATTSLSMRETTEMYKRLAVDDAVGTDKKDQVAGIIDAQYAAYKRGVAAYQADTAQQETDTKLLLDKPKDKAAALVRNSRDAGLQSMRDVSPLLVKTSLRDDLTEVLPPEYFAAAKLGMSGIWMNELTIRAQALMKADASLELGRAYSQAGEEAAIDPNSKLFQTNLGERVTVLNALRPRLLDQLGSTYEGTGITVSDLDLGTLGKEQKYKLLNEYMLETFAR